MMSKATLDLGRADLCIEHWGRLERDERIYGEDPDSSHCAFCKQYYDKDCRGCPVQMDTGEDCCYGTPYAEAVLLWNFPSDIPRKGFPEAARAMRVWLVALRKKLARKLKTEGSAT